MASARALAEAGVGVADIGYAAIYDSFTITLAILLEEIGLSRRGASGRDAAAGRYDADGPLPLNTHGGLLSYGHCGVGGARWRISSRRIASSRDARAPGRSAANPPWR